MASTQPPMPVERNASEIDYLPVSNFAVAAIIVSGFSVLLLTITAVSAFIKKRPALDTIYLLFLSGLGLALSIIARLHIKRSEGTRTGLKVASVAWWLSVLGCAAFGAYYLASIMSLRQQSEATAMEWFDLLKQKKIDHAFVFTIEPTIRQNVNPDNPSDLDARFGAVPLPTFRNCELARFFLRNGEDAQVFTLGIGSWQQVPGGYRGEGSFRLTSPEGVFVADIFLIGTEGENIVGRQWYISMTDGLLKPVNRTTYGRMIGELKDEAEKFAMNWIENVRADKIEDIAIDSLPTKDQNGILMQLIALRLAENALGHSLPAALIAQLDSNVLASDREFMFPELLARGFFQIEGAQFLTEEKKSLLRETWKIGMMARAGGQRLQNSDTSTHISVTTREILFSLPVEIKLPGGQFSFTKGRVLVASTVPEIVKEMNDLKAKGKANPDEADTTPRALLEERVPRQWKVVRIETNLEALSMPQAPPGGPGGPGGPGRPPGMPGMGGPGGP